MTLPPLLALAEGRKPRLRRAPVERPKEISLHLQVAALLRSHCRADWQWFHCPNGEARDARTAAKLKAMGVRAGVPDLCLVSPTGQIHFLELKRSSETLSEPQESFQSWCAEYGVAFRVVKSFADARAAFVAWRCLDDVAANLLEGAR